MDCNEELHIRLKNRMNWNDFWQRYSDHIEDDAYRYCLANNQDTDGNSQDMKDARKFCADDFIEDNNLDVNDRYPDKDD
jgi:hypothetical protein